MNYLKLLNLTRSQPKGFTLLEMIFTTVMVGILAAVGIPSIQKTIELENLKNAASQVNQAISKAQANSTQRNEYWQFSLRSNGGILQYAVHQVSIDPYVSPGSISWTSLPSQIQLDTSTNGTQVQTNMNSLNSIYQVCFTEQGVPSTVQTGTGTARCTIPATLTTPQQITLKDKNTPNAPYRRCIIIATLLGALTTGQDQSVAQNGFTCY